MDLVRVKTGRGETRILAEEEIRRNMAGVEMNLYNTYDIRYYAYMYVMLWNYFKFYLNLLILKFSFFDCT